MLAKNVKHGKDCDILPDRKLLVIHNKIISQYREDCDNWENGWDIPIDKGVRHTICLQNDSDDLIPDWIGILCINQWQIYLPCGSDSKESTSNAGDLGSMPELGRSSREGNGYPLQYSCLENSMDRGAWQASVPGAAKESDTIEQLSTHTHNDQWREEQFQCERETDHSQFRILGDTY